uniref:CUB domain-containing protein n=1 Tax=Lotharella oceanica TaxID=641309 RepID=A0A7S2TZ00_9EUKA
MPPALTAKCPVLAAAVVAVAFWMFPQSAASPVLRSTPSPTGEASLVSCAYGYHMSPDRLVVASAVDENREYYHNVSCRFVVAASQIIFNYVDIDRGDQLHVHAGYDLKLDAQNADFCLTRMQLPSPIADPAPITSTSGYFSFWWVTNEGGARSGWNFTILASTVTTEAPTPMPTTTQKLVSPPTLSPSTVTAATTTNPVQTCFKYNAEGSVQHYTSATGPDGMYFNNVSCRFVVEASTIQFDLFDVEWQDDYLEIFFGDDEKVSAGMADSHKVTGTLLPSPIAKPKPLKSTSGHITLLWSTNEQQTNRGWSFVTLNASTPSPTFQPRFQSASSPEPNLPPTAFPTTNPRSVATSRLLNTELPSLPDSSPIGFRYFYHHLTCDETERAIVCAPLHSETITRIDTGTETIISMPVQTTDGEGQNPKYATCGSVEGDMILCSPYSVQHALYIDATGGSTLAETMTDRSYPEKEKYVACSAIGRKLYCAPYRASGVLVIDAETRTSRKLTDVTYTSEYKYYYDSCAPLSSKIYCAPFDSQYVLAIDSATDTSQQWTSINYGSSLSKYSTCKALSPANSRTKIFCAPYHADNVLVIDPDDPAGETSYALKQARLTGDYQFSSCAVSGAKLICAPEEARQVLVIDANPDAESYRLIGLPFEGAQKHYMGRSCVTKASLVYCAPWDSQYVLKIDVSQESTMLLTDEEYPNPDQWGQCNLDPTGNNRIFCAPARPNSILVIDV